MDSKEDGWNVKIKSTSPCYICISLQIFIKRSKVFSTLQAVTCHAAADTDGLGGKLLIFLHGIPIDG